MLIFLYSTHLEYLWYNDVINHLDMDIQSQPADFQPSLHIPPLLECLRRAAEHLANEDRSVLIDTHLNVIGGSNNAARNRFIKTVANRFKDMCGVYLYGTVATFSSLLLEDYSINKQTVVDVLRER